MDLPEPSEDSLSNECTLSSVETSDWSAGRCHLGLARLISCEMTPVPPFDPCRLVLRPSIWVDWPQNGVGGCLGRLALWPPLHALDQYPDRWMELHTRILHERQGGDSRNSQAEAQIETAHQAVCCTSTVLYGTQVPPTRAAVNHCYLGLIRDPVPGCFSRQTIQYTVNGLG